MEWKWPGGTEAGNRSERAGGTGARRVYEIRTAGGKRRAGRIRIARGECRCYFPFGVRAETRRSFGYLAIQLLPRRTAAGVPLRSDPVAR